MYYFYCERYNILIIDLLNKSKNDVAYISSTSVLKKHDNLMDFI